MCLDLIKHSPKPFVAETDIVCYKFMRKLSRKQYQTPFQCMEILIGEKYSINEMRVRKLFTDDEINTAAVPDDTYVGSVHDGFHSLPSIKTAYYETLMFSRRRVVKCVIPKGSTYFIGDFNGDISYASNNIVYVRSYSKFSTFFLSLFKSRMKFSVDNLNKLIDKLCV